MKVVRLKVSYGSNVAGEVCGFPDSEAKRLVALGGAVYVDPPAPVAPPPPPAPEPASVAQAEEPPVLDKMVDTAPVTKPLGRRGRRG